MKPHSLATLGELLPAPSPVDPKMSPSRPAATLPTQPTEKLYRSRQHAQKGGRNATAASLLGKLFHDLDVDLWGIEAWGALKEWNASLDDPLPEKELRLTYASIRKTHERDSAKDTEKKNKEDPLRLILASGIRYFHDQRQEAYVMLPVGDQQ